ncbi:GGDEF domain-containing protein [Aliikangiella sp. G2MR2-5]|uniref:GGDEF domain-containing protein n=1 Tax=Aliikangiella sp. G2MR2-5 TaxID=2788943 RepID=UPI001AEEC127|nr:GGDEF domain-containing protein [Aliikangiella sp. G2MR2-5]
MADKVKSSDSARFVSLLRQLEPQFQNLSINERYFFLYLKGYESALKGLVDEAERSYLHVFKNAQSVEIRYRAALSLVNLYAFSRKWGAGLEFIRFIEISKEKIIDTNIRHQGLIAAAIFYDEIEYHKVTITYLSEVLKESNDKRSICLAQGMNLKAQRLIGAELDFRKEFNNAIDICAQANEQIIANVIRIHLAHFLLKEGKAKEASDLILENLPNIEKTRYQLNIVQSYSILSRAYWSLEDILNAKKYAQKAVDSDAQVNTTRSVAEAYNILHLSSLKQNNLEDAIRYLRDYFEAEKKHFQEINGRQLAIESAKRQSAEKDAEIDSLNKQNSILRLQQELAKEEAENNRWIISLLVFCVAILIAWILYFRSSQRKLKYLAEYDGLTGICNRAHFTRSAEDVLQIMTKSGRNVSMVLFDLDNFKKINDAYGHPVGDIVLQLATKACSQCVRKVDVFGRIGGEEFAILLPGCEIEQAQKIAEDCRKRVSEIDTSSTGFEFDVSASFGIANTRSTGYLLKDLISHADEAMYLAKRRGRNQVVVQPTE